MILPGPAQPSPALLLPALAVGLEGTAGRSPSLMPVPAQHPFPGHRARTVGVLGIACLGAEVDAMGRVGALAGSWLPARSGQSLEMCIRRLLRVTARPCSGSTRSSLPSPERRIPRPCSFHASGPQGAPLPTPNTPHAYSTQNRMRMEPPPSAQPAQPLSGLLVGTVTSPNKLSL